MNEEEKQKYLNALLSMYDYLKLVDNEIIGKKIDIDMLGLNNEILTEMFFRKLEAYNIDLNKELGWDHLKPRTKG